MTLTGTAKQAANARAASKRQRELQAAAERDGFGKLSAALTAWKRGEYRLVKVKRNNIAAQAAEEQGL
jgi:hypothetical protein